MSVAGIIFCSIANARCHESRLDIVHLIGTDPADFVQIYSTEHFNISVIITSIHNIWIKKH